MDIKIQVAIIAASTSVVTTVLSLLVKSFMERRFHVFKLQAEHRYEQRKEIKRILSRNKIRFLNACESLNNRLWNFTSNYRHDWHCVNGNFNVPKQYYFNSFVYRLVCVFGWIQRIENEMVYLDTTIASREDMAFLRYLRLLPQVMCDISLFQGFDYDENHDTDHFFRNDFDKMVEGIMTEDGVYTFSQFEDTIETHVQNMRGICCFLDGISPNEERLRWDRLYLLHISLVALMNAFGYDFQCTDKAKIRHLLQTPRKGRLNHNFVALVSRNQMSNQKELRPIVRLMGS